LRCHREREKNKFVRGLQQNVASDQIEKLFRALSSTDVENANASHESDRVNILEIIKKGTGYDKVSITINDLIRKWVLQLIKDAACSKRNSVSNGGYDGDCALFHQRAGLIFQSLGDHDHALEMFNVELKMKEKKFGRHHDLIYYPLVNIAIINIDQGKYNEAMNNCTRALDIIEKVYGSDHAKAANTLNRMEEIFRKQCEYDMARQSMY